MDLPRSRSRPKEGWVDSTAGTIENRMGNAPQIAGAEHVVKWFGYWPKFHDAEVLSISLDRRTGARVSIYVVERTSDVDSAGY
jgi:hypothetical protein